MYGRFPSDARAKTLLALQRLRWNCCKFIRIKPQHWSVENTWPFPLIILCLKCDLQTFRTVWVLEYYSYGDQLQVLPILVYSPPTYSISVCNDTEFQTRLNVRCDYLIIPVIRGVVMVACRVRVVFHLFDVCLHTKHRRISLNNNRGWNSELLVIIMHASHLLVPDP